MPEGARPLTKDELELLARNVTQWLEEQAAANPVVAAVERDVDGPGTWFVRLRGEEKDVFTIRFRLDQRTLAYETYVMPAPIENQEVFYLHLLRRNRGLHGASFWVGEEDAVYLGGQLGNDSLSDVAIDRILGSIYVWVERFFRPALTLGFASKLRN